MLLFCLFTIVMAGRVFYVDAEKEEWKLDTLCDLCEFLPTSKSVIFVNTRCKVDWLADKMRGRDYTVSATHGDMDQNTRNDIMAEFTADGSQSRPVTDEAVRTTRTFCVLQAREQ